MLWNPRLSGGAVIEKQVVVVYFEEVCTQKSLLLETVTTLRCPKGPFSMRLYPEFATMLHFAKDVKNLVSIHLELLKCLY